MFGSQILDVAIGMLFVFVLVSIVCSAVREGMEGWLKTRATYLERGIRELLHDRNAEGLVRHFFEHPLIYSQYSGDYLAQQDSAWWPVALTRGRNLPSYITSRNFALALLDLAARGPVTDEASGHPASAALTLERVRTNVLNIDNPAVQRVLLTAMDEAQGDLQRTIRNLEAWYDSGMDRISGWYKRSTQWILFGIGLFVAMALNVNTLAILHHLYQDQAAREALVARAEALRGTTALQDGTYREIQRELTSLSLPIGWSVERARPFSPPEVALGWLVTALAATLGAPFWFDLLNKTMVIRSTVKPHEKSPEESSEDRQIGRARGAQPVNALEEPGTRPGTKAATRHTFAPVPAALEAVDGCDVEIANFTPDEDLPAAEGGTA